MKKKPATRPLRLNPETVRPLDADLRAVTGGGSFVETVRICLTLYVPSVSC